MYTAIYAAYQLIAFVGVVFCLVHWLQTRHRNSLWFGLVFLVAWLGLTAANTTIRVASTIWSGLPAYLLPNSKYGLLIPTLVILGPWVYYGRQYLAAAPAKPPRKRQR